MVTEVSRPRPQKFSNDDHRNRNSFVCGSSWIVNVFQAAETKLHITSVFEGNQLDRQENRLEQLDKHGEQV